MVSRGAFNGNRLMRWEATLVDECVRKRVGVMRGYWIRAECLEKEIGLSMRSGIVSVKTSFLPIGQ